MTIREYYKQFLCQLIWQLNEIDNVSERYKLPMLIHDIDKLNKFKLTKFNLYLKTFSQTHMKNLHYQVALMVKF